VVPDVNPQRAYNSDGRRRRAAANRTAVLDAAHQAFLEHGYAAASVPAIAAAAGVSAEFVYKAFGAKPALLKTVFDRSIAGDDQPVPLQDRPDIQRLAALTDTSAVLDGYAQFLGQVQVRVAPVHLLARSAAAADPAAAPILEQMNAERLAGMAAMATQLLRLGHVRNGLGRDEVRDILWTFNSPEIYELLVLQRGWSVTRYVEFVRDSLKAALLA
jgi:TetR/AcrR family transcriptional regulator, regulator of autoinduction and epiphytic fitness